MTVVSTKEFNAHQEKYFDMAVNEQVFIQKDDCMFVVSRANEPKKKHKKPDEKLRNAVTMDEVKDRLHTHIHKLFANKNESISNA
jgi:calcineurin-like phosphoesterase family protein